MPTRNILSPTKIIYNFLVATIKKKKKEIGEMNFNNMLLNLTDTKYYHFNL